MLKKQTLRWALVKNGTLPLDSTLGSGLISLGQQYSKWSTCILQSILQPADLTLLWCGLPFHMRRDKPARQCTAPTSAVTPFCIQILSCAAVFSRKTRPVVRLVNVREGEAVRDEVGTLIHILSTASGKVSSGRSYKCDMEKKTENERKEVILERLFSLPETYHSACWRI